MIVPASIDFDRLDEYTDAELREILIRDSVYTDDDVGAAVRRLRGRLLDPGPLRDEMLKRVPMQPLEEPGR